MESKARVFFVPHLHQQQSLGQMDWKKKTFFFLPCFFSWLVDVFRGILVDF